jgi:maleylacetoacetate isomerase
MDLYNFFNSSAAFRVRIAMALKGIEWRHYGINLRAGEQNDAEYTSLNPGRLVPTLRDGERTITQSIAIFDYLDRAYPEPRLIPKTPGDRARALEIAMSIACDIHPLNNLRVLKYLTGTLNLTEAEKNAWIAHWLTVGFTTLEALLPERGVWCVGEKPSIADCCLIPQIANAIRVKFDLQPFPRARRIFESCMSLPAFQQAAPAAMPDYVAH